MNFPCEYDQDDVLVVDDYIPDDETLRVQVREGLFRSSRGVVFLSREHAHQLRDHLNNVLGEAS